MYLPWAVDEFQSIILMVGWWTVRWRACTHTPRHQGCVCVLNFNIQVNLQRNLHYTLILQIHRYICMKNTSAKQNKEWEEVSLIHFSPRSWVWHGRCQTEPSAPGREAPAETEYKDSVVTFQLPFTWHFTLEKLWSKHSILVPSFLMLLFDIKESKSMTMTIINCHKKALLDVQTLSSDVWPSSPEYYLWLICKIEVESSGDRCNNGV